MKKKFGVALALVLVLAMSASLSFAKNSFQGLPIGTSWSTGIQIQNVGSANANIVMTGYDVNGATTYTDSTTGANVPSFSSVNYTTFPSAVSTFNGSAVVSSDQPVVAIVNINNGGAGGYAAGQYQGVDSSKASTTVRFPLVKNNFGSKCTTFFIQNAGSSAAVIYASFSNGSTWNSGSPVNPGVMVTIDPAAATPAVPGTSPYALTVTSTQSLAGTVAEAFCTNASLLQSTRGFGDSDGASTLLAPIYKYSFGSRSTGLQVQNIGGSAADIYVSYSHAPLSSCQPSCAAYSQHQLSVPAGKSVTFFKNIILAAAGGGSTGSTGTPLPTGSLAAATVTSSGTIVAIVNESFDSLPEGFLRNTATTYSAQPSTAAATKLAIPLTKEVFSNKTTGIQIQNAGGVMATVVVTYKLNAGAVACQGTYVLNNLQINSGASATLFHLSSAVAPAGSSWAAGNTIKAGCFGSAIIQSTNGQPLVAIVNEADINPTISARQDNKNYEAFPLP
jgi:hypothetical protein